MRTFFNCILPDLQKNRAFTLAEVLLTLAIIGVVAALTIPAVITKATKEQYVTGLKKAFNTLKSVEREAIREHGKVENWDTWAIPDTRLSFDAYFKPYFDILKDCGAEGKGDCFSEKYKYLNGLVVGGDSLNKSTSYNFITSDGMAYAYSPGGVYPSHAANFMVDVNGKKGPNIVGRDIFFFVVFRNAGVKPYGALTIIEGAEAIPSSEVNEKCSVRGDGYYCAAKVLSEGTMNY